MLSSKQRKFLRGLAHHVKPVAQVGRHGLSEALVREVSQALDAHELIKVKFVEHKEERKKYSADLAEQTESDLVGILGNNAILFRFGSEEKDRPIAAEVNALV